jgi:beta-glucosidase
MNRQYLDPVFLGRYPDELKAMFGNAWPRHAPADLERIRQPMDFLGVNYYSRGVTRHDPGVPVVAASATPPAGAARTAMGWEVYPDGLREILCWIRESYGSTPLYVTENGAAFEDPSPASDGIVEDAPRVDYFGRHLGAARQAIAAGVDLRGYFAWSLLDNFEWQHGYAKRFGLVQVDFATQRRTLKRSALHYREVIRTRGAAASGGELPTWGAG